MYSNITTREMDGLGFTGGFAMVLMDGLRNIYIFTFLMQPLVVKVFFATTQTHICLLARIYQVVFENGRATLVKYASNDKLKLCLVTELQSHKAVLT